MNPKAESPEPESATAIPDQDLLTTVCAVCHGPLESVVLRKSDGSRIIRWSCGNCCVASEAMLH